MLTEVLRKNLDIVFLVYGAAFFAMGIAIFMKRRQGSVFSLAGILWLLVGFGIIHGINEWLDMITLIKRYRYDFWNITRTAVLTLSYICLFEFGRRLISLSVKRFLNKWATLLVSVFVLALIFISEHERTIWPRYLLGFPGGALAAYGFNLYYRNNKSVLKLFGVRRYFVVATISVGIYGVLGGLVTPKANFFPASVINTLSFLNIVGIPVQVFCAFCAVALAWSVCNILNIFDWEVISDLKQSLKEITAAKNYIDNIIESIVDVLIVVDSHAKISLVNEAACRVLGYQREELLGRPVRQIFAEGDIFDNVKFHKLIKARHFENYELTCLSKDKVKIPMLFSGSAIKGLNSGKTELAVIGKDLRELRHLQEKLASTEKLAAMGKVAGIIGHEFRNQLGVIRNSVYFINMKLQDRDEQIKKHLSILDHEVVEADRIVENILTFSRVKHPEFKNIDLKDLLLAAINKLKIPDDIVVIKQIDANLPNIEVDEVQISRVFINIILNALEAMKEKGELVIKAAAENNHISIVFKDNGPGIKEEDKKKLFEPFFSTKAKGTGLGLATSKVIIEAHGGSIDIESGSGRGTEVIIKLPIKRI